MAFAGSSPAKHSIHCLLRLWRKDKGSTIVFSKAQPSKTFQVLRFATPSQPSMPFTLNAKAPPNEALQLLCLLVFLKSSSSICLSAFVFEGPAHQSLAFTVFWDCEGKISVALLCFRRLNRTQNCIWHVSKALTFANYCIYCFPKALRSKVSRLFMLATA